VDLYPKIKKRNVPFFGFSFIDPPVAEKRKILLRMEEELSARSIELYTCCEKEVLDKLPHDSGIKNSSCIPNDLFKELSGGTISLKKDRGQRIKKGCGCMISTDVGSYKEHPCFHNCLFCYGNPSERKP